MGETGGGRRAAATPSSSTATATITVPGFELLEELGRGARTIVFRARASGSDGPDVALKILRRPADDADQIAAVFRREAALLARVSHPSLAAVRAVGEAGGRPYLVLELVNGTSLARLVENGPLVEDRVLDIAIDAAAALDAAHRMRLVHRDVKPHNLLVTPAGRAKLIDFDLATWSGELNATETVTGTLSYSAPEQTGMLTRPVDARTDLYALGVVLFECVTGGLPFASPDVGELLRLHAVEPPPDVRTLRPECSPGIAAVIATLLAKDPDDRYQTAVGLISDLRRLREQPGASLDPARSDGPATATAPALVGRAAELSALASYWHGTAAAGSVVLVEGTAGIGKSRLVEELLARVSARDGCALRAACVAHDPRPLGAIASAVQRHVEAPGRLPAQERDQAAARLRRAAGDAAPLLAALSAAAAAVLDVDPPTTGAADRQEQIPTAIASFLGALARLEGRMLLVLEDVEHIDDTSARVLSRLRLDDPDAPLMIVVTATPDASGAAEADHRIRLGSLPPAAVTELIATELGGAKMPSDIAGQLVARTGGNPFTALELLRHLIEAGGLQPSWGTWKLDGELLDRLHLPSDVLDLMLARLEGVPPATRRLLARAAVQGMRFDATVLAASVSARASASEPGGGDRRVRASASEPGGGDLIAGEEVADAIAAATRHRIAEHRSGEVYAFVHAELHAALLAHLDRAEVARQHRAIAEALDARPSADADHHDAVARHWVAAGLDVEPRRTYTACVTAGRAALARHAPGDAAELLAHAARAATVAGLDLDASFHQDYATALLRSGDFAAALDQLHAALVVAPDALRRAELRNLIATAQYSMGDGDGAIGTVARALEEIGAALPRRLPALIASTVAGFLAGLLVGASRRWFGTATGTRRQRYIVEAALLETGAYAASIVSDDRMLVILMLRGLLPVNRIGPSPYRVRSIAGLSFLAAMVGAHRLGLRVSAAAERAAAGSGDPTLVALAGWMRGNMLSTIERRTAPVTDALETHGRWLDLPYYLAGITGLMPHLLSNGYVTLARTWIDRARKRLELGGSPSDTFAVDCLAAAVDAMQGRASAAEAIVEAALARLPGPPTRQQRMHLAWARLIILTEQGEFGAAFDDVAADIDGMRLPARHYNTLAMRYTMTFGRLIQVREATGAERDRRLRQARAGIRSLGRGRGTPKLRAGRLAFRAWLRLLSGRERAALRVLHRALRAADGADSPLLTFDLAVLHAQILRVRGLDAETQRQAMAALTLAIEYGWEFRARWVRAEFGLQHSGSGSHHSYSRVSGRGSTSPRHSDLHQRRRLEALTQVSATAASVLDPEELIRVALDSTMRLLSAERIFVFLAEERPDAGRDALVPHRGRDAEGNVLHELTDYSTTLVDRVWETGETLVVTGSEQGVALGSESAVVHGLRSILVAPLQLKGRVLGVVYLDSRVARGVFTEEDGELLGMIAQQVAAALETARAAQLESAVRVANEQRDLAETLRASMTDLSSTLDPDEVLRRLFATVVGALPGSTALLLRNAGTLRARASASEPAGGELLVADAADGTASRRWNPAEPIAIDVDRHADAGVLVGDGTPVVGGLDQTAPRLPDSVATVLGEPRSWLAVPVALRRELAGVVVVGSSEPAGYADVEVHIAAALAEQGAVAYENARLFSRVHELATVDDLTRTATRRHFWELAEKQRAAAVRYHRPLAAIMLDIDRFKAVNDTHGHAVGDGVLREVAARLRGEIRDADLIGRYGGEEFALLLPETAEASAVAERLRETVERAPIEAGDVTLRVTVSVGVSFLRPGEDLDALFVRADAALYRSKDEGRNRVTIAETTDAGGDVGQEIGRPPAV